MVTELLKPPTCALCKLTVPPDRGVLVEQQQFCCAGCHAVYNVLQARQELAQGMTHPLFKEAAQAGLIANPALLEQLRQRQATEATSRERHKLYLGVNGLMVSFLLSSHRLGGRAAAGGDPV